MTLSKLALAALLALSTTMVIADDKKEEVTEKAEKKADAPAEEGTDKKKD